MVDYILYHVFYHSYFQLTLYSLLNYEKSEFHRELRDQGVLPQKWLSMNFFTLDPNLAPQ